MKFLSTTQRTKLSPLFFIFATLATVSSVETNDNSPASKEALTQAKPQPPGQHKQTLPQPGAPVSQGTNTSPNQYGNKPLAPGLGPQQKPQNKNAAQAGNRDRGAQTGQQQNAKQDGQNLKSANQTPNRPAPMQGNSVQRPNQNLNKIWAGQNPTGNRVQAGGNPNGNQQLRNNVPGSAGSGKIGQWQNQPPWQNYLPLKNADQTKKTPMQVAPGTAQQTAKTQNGATPKEWIPSPGAARESDMFSNRLSNTGGTQTSNSYRQPEGSKSEGPVSQAGNALASSKIRPEPETKAGIAGSPDRVNKPQIITDPSGKPMGGGGGGVGMLGSKSRGNSTSTMPNPKFTEAIERVKYVMVSVVMTVVGVALMALALMASLAKRRRRQRYMRCEGFGDECELRSNFQLGNNDERLGLRNSTNYFM